MAQGDITKEIEYDKNEIRVNRTDPLEKYWSHYVTASRVCKS